MKKSIAKTLLLTILFYAAISHVICAATVKSPSCNYQYKMSGVDEETELSVSVYMSDKGGYIENDFRPGFKFEVLVEPSEDNEQFITVILDDGKAHNCSYPGICHYLFEADGTVKAGQSVLDALQPILRKVPRCIKTIPKTIKVTDCSADVNLSLKSSKNEKYVKQFIKRKGYKVNVIDEESDEIATANIEISLGRATSPGGENYPDYLYFFVDGVDEKGVEIVSIQEKRGLSWFKGEIRAAKKLLKKLPRCKEL